MGHDETGVPIFRESQTIASDGTRSYGERGERIVSISGNKNKSGIAFEFVI